MSVTYFMKCFSWFCVDITNSFTIASYFSIATLSHSYNNVCKLAFEKERQSFNEFFDNLIQNLLKL